MKAIEQCFHLLFIMLFKVVLSFKSVDIRVSIHMKAIEQYFHIYFCKVVCFLSFYLKFDTLGVSCLKSSPQSILSKRLDPFQSVLPLKL